MEILTLMVKNSFLGMEMNEPIILALKTIRDSVEKNKAKLLDSEDILEFAVTKKQKKIKEANGYSFLKKMKQKKDKKQALEEEELDKKKLIASGGI